jgi:hypothetical protein
MKELRESPRNKTGATEIWRRAIEGRAQVRYGDQQVLISDVSHPDNKHNVQGSIPRIEHAPLPTSGTGREGIIDGDRENEDKERIRRDERDGELRVATIRK